MEPRERVLRAVAHEEADRTPVDYWAVAEVDRSLIRATGTSGREELLRRLGVDIRYVEGKYVGPPLERTGNGEWTDLWGVRRRRVKASFGSYDEVSYSPLASATGPEEVYDAPWPSPDWFDFSPLRRARDEHGAFALANHADRLNRTSVLKAAVYLRGMENVMTDLALKPELAKALFDRIAEFYLAANERMFEAARGQLDVFFMGDDFGAQSGLLVSRKMWKEFFVPHLRRFTEQARSYGLSVMFHSCGAIREIVPDLVELGVDIINPVQARAAGMDPRELKKEFGERVTFHGSVDIQDTVPKGTVEDVKKEVRERIEILGEGGGFILAPCHNFQADCPVENILAVYEEAGSLRE